MRTSTIGQKLEGTAKEIGGRFKRSLGKLIGDRRMEAEGKARELEGRARREAAAAAERESTEGKAVGR